MGPLRLNKTSKIIFAIAIVLLSTGLGYLIWRVNNTDNLDPDDGSAACPDGCYWNAGFAECTGSGGCLWVCSDGTQVTNPATCPGGTATGHECDPCVTDDPEGCASIPNEGSSGPVASSCDESNCGGPCGVYTYKCGTLCYDASCGAAACGYVPPATTFTLSYAAGSGGSISGSASQTVNQGASGTAVTAVPSTGYTFVKWSDNSTSATRTDSNVQGNISVTASFQIKTYSLTYNADSNGTVTGTKTQTVNHGSSGTTVTAVPNTNYRFASWSDGVTTASRTDTNVTSNLSATANFTILGSYSLTYIAGDNGSISGDTSQSVYEGGSGTKVEAVPDEGYNFVKWSDDVTTAERTDTNVTKDITVTATFSANCGNGVCGTDEDAYNCPADCPAVCGDGYCTHDETFASCPSDCEGSSGGVPQTGIFDSTLGRLSVGLALVVIGALVYIAPTISLSVHIKNGKMYIRDKNVSKVRKIFERKFK